MLLSDISMQSANSQRPKSKASQKSGQSQTSGTEETVRTSSQGPVNYSKNLRVV